MNADLSDHEDTGKFDALIERYAQDIRTHFGEAELDTDLLVAVAKHLGSQIFDRDGALVAATDDEEMKEVHAFVTDTLGAPDGPAVNRAIDAAIQTYGRSNRHKYRAVLYHVLARRLGRAAVLLAEPGDTTASTGSPGTSSGTTSPKTPGNADAGSPPAEGSGSGGGNSIEGGNQMPAKKPIHFLDALEAEDRAKRKLQGEFDNLQAIKIKGNARLLTSDEERKFKLLDGLLNAKVTPDFALDDTYLTMRELMASLICQTDTVPALKKGRFGTGQNVAEMSAEELATASVWGTLAGEGILAPSLLDATVIPVDDAADPKGYAAEFRTNPRFFVKLPQPTARFAETLTRAFAKFNSNIGLYTRVLQVMAEAADVNQSGAVKASEWVVVTEALIARGVTDQTPSLETLIRAAIDDRLSPARDKVTATAQIVLPDLEQSTAQQVQRVNLEAAQAIYFAAMMDEARLFDVMEKLAELFQIGALPLERGAAGETLYQYIRKTPDRISAFERRNTYARVFGTATGDPNATGAQFRNFDDLWLRFVSAVSDWYRKNQVENLFASNGRYVPSQEQVRKTGLDLAANLSLYCYGGTWFVASELQKDIAAYVDLLSSQEIRSLYGARDMWQVIDQVSVLEFGAPVNTIRARTMANSGAIIIGWLEKKADAISVPGSILIDPDAIKNPPRRSTSNAINDPSDYDLVTACEQWLAIEGVGQEIVDMKSDASPSAVTTTSPIRVPPAAQEILGAFGFSHDGAGRSNGRTGRFA